jgi:tetratricopeptide (TPR) repeat protein
MTLPLLVSLLFAPQALGDSGSLTLANGPYQHLLKTGQYFRYVRTLEQELVQSPANASLHASLALGYYLLGQHRFCEEEIQQALALADTAPAPPAAVSAQVHYLAGRLAMENTKYQAAANHLQAVLLLDPANSKAEYFLALCLQTLNQQETARAHFEHACDAAIYSWPCRALAEIELDSRNAIAAQRRAAQAIQIETRSPEAQLVAGKAAQSLADASAAESFFRRAAELDPSWEVPHYFLAHLYQKMPGKTAEAAHELALYQELYNASQ